MVVHFYKKEFNRCFIVNKHLEKLAEKHYNIKFVKIDVTECNFLTTKLKIKVLPCVVLFENGISIDWIIGFDDFNKKDDFSLQDFEKRLNVKKFL